MIEIVLIVAGVWLLLLLFVWALAVAAGRADGTTEAGEASRHAVGGPELRAEPEAEAEAEAEAEVKPQPPPVVVADLAALRVRLGAAAVMLRAHRVSVVVLANRDEEHEVAAAGEPLPRGRAQEIGAPIGARSLIIAARAAPGAAFDESDHRLLAAIAGSLGDVLTIPDDEGPPPTGRFARRRSQVLRRRH